MSLKASDPCMHAIARNGFSLRSSRWLGVVLASVPVHLEHKGIKLFEVSIVRLIKVKAATARSGTRE